MELSQAVAGLSALAQDTRLKVFRLLVRAGPKGLPAGDIARELDVPANTMSSHLGILSRAGLIAARKRGTSIFYAIDLGGTRDLLAYLVEDCCGGKPDVCRPLIATGARCVLRRVGGNAKMNAMSKPEPFNVLFLCTGNSARSIMAECILNREGLGTFKAYSAGSTPTGQVNPFALALLRRLNYDVSGLRSKSWDAFAGPDAPKFDFVFTVCDNAAQETCPVWPGQPMTAHWGVPDPASVDGSQAQRAFAFDDVYRMLNQRISIFVNLPLDSLSKLSLQKQLDEIGRMTRQATKESA